MNNDELRQLIPNYPRIVIERLPRTQEVGGIVLTDDNNKPLHEGIVIRTWAPWTKQISASALDAQDLAVLISTMKTELRSTGGEYDHLYREGVKLCLDNLGRVRKSIAMESQVKPGDHVVFPHWAPKTDDTAEKIVVVNEFEITGIVHPDPETLHKKLISVLVGYTGDDAETVESLAQAVEEHFVIVPKLSITRSGSGNRADWE